MVFGIIENPALLAGDIRSWALHCLPTFGSHQNIHKGVCAPFYLQLQTSRSATSAANQQKCRPALQVLPTARLTLARTLKRLQAPEAGSLHTPLDTLTEHDSEVDSPVPQPSAEMAPARRPGDSRSAALRVAVSVAVDSQPNALLHGPHCSCKLAEVPPRAGLSAAN